MNDHLPEECPVCFIERDDPFVIWDSPENSGWDTGCSHWLCTRCWAEIREAAICPECCVVHTVCCPICRTDVTDWIEDAYGTDSDSEPESSDSETADKN